MQVEQFVKTINVSFYAGVPDSLLKPLCNYLMDTYGIDPKHHVIAANEGNCTAYAAGYYLATGEVPLVYMQNSGEGNIINPVASLLNDQVYGIPMIFVVGWRGEPGVHDEPQHIYQGKVTVKLLEDMDISTYVVTKETSLQQLQEQVKKFQKQLSRGKQVAFVIKKGALSFEKKIQYKNKYNMNREEIIRHIIKTTGDDPIISTTGKASRELFEIREENHQSHKYDFLTVGSMGHTSSIALGVAEQKKDTKIWCVDGDGSMLMHMGAMAVIGAMKPANLVHIVINNGAHETVGGLPTVADEINIVAIAKACGYENVVQVDNFEMLDCELNLAKKGNLLTFIEIKCAIGAREDLGRPTTTAAENREKFMAYLEKL